ncbi:hypothetical protein I317_07868 [Kwoniella heveanensis CBS 569]|nr:hypothetical protein I317_07868 [Kwoniella heveanensis CBS 569]
MPSKSTPWSIYLGLWTPLPAAPKGDYLKDKVIVITGATSGLGLEATKAFAAASPAKLILAVRAVEAGQKVLADLQRKHPKVEGEVVYIDSTEVESIKAFAEKVKEFGRVEVLVNNAAISPNFSDGPFRATNDGYERVLQPNVIAPVLTTLLIEPLLEASKDPKVIFVGSDTHCMADESIIKECVDKHESILDTFNDPKRYDNGARYFQSKLLLQMITRSLIPSLPNINIINVNPSLARTNLGREIDAKFNFETIRSIVWFLSNARSATSAARSLTTAVAWSEESHDYWSECAPSCSPSTFLTSCSGIKATKQFYAEVKEELEKISPGLTAGLQL